MSCTSRRLLLFQGGLSGASTGTLTYDGALYDPVLDRLITTSPDGDQIIVGGTGARTSQRTSHKQTGDLALATAETVKGCDLMILDDSTTIRFADFLIYAWGL
jgi:hypothetical protein